MKKPNITPGEWTVSALSPADGKYIFKGTDVNPVCALAEWTEEGVLQNDFFPENQEANAKAISAVPGMIDALIEAYCEIEAIVNTWGKRRELHDMYPTLEQIEQALIKAGVEL